MIMILDKINEAIKESRGSPNLKVLEEDGRLTLSNVSIAHAGRSWGEVYDEGSEWLSIICIDDMGDEIDPRSASPEEVVKIKISYSLATKAHHVFTTEGLKSLLHDDKRLEMYERIRVCFCTEDEIFQTAGIQFEKWTEEAHCKQDFDGVEGVNVARYVSSLHPDYMPPAVLQNWILLGKKSGSAFSEGDLFKTWESIALSNLLKALVNELGLGEGGMNIRLHGSPTRTLPFGNSEKCTDLLDQINQAIQWVYFEGEDVEVRHTFLTAELARLSNEVENYVSLVVAKLPVSLESARLMYKAHLRSSSKETLKSLSDLRKNLTEDMQRVMVHTNYLAVSVWKNVALSIAVVGLRVFFYAARSEVVTAGFLSLYFLVAIYIFVSYLMASSISDKFVELQMEAVSSWRKHLYGYLNEGEYENLVGGYLSRAQKEYLNVRCATSIIVSFMIGLIALLFFYDLKVLLS